jgi:hypothetical protein
VIAPDLLPLARPIASLREDPQNARKHDKRNLDAIAKSLTEFGQRKPVVALTDGTVIAGNGTLAAARSLGWTDIAVATFEDEQKAKAYAVADNRAGELATWDDDLLVAALSGIDEGLRAACGFSSAELERLLHVEGRGDGDDVPEAPSEPTTKRGDLWLLGDHRLLCGDSTSAADVARVLDGDAPRLLLTDPPYGVSLDMEWRDRAGLNGLGPAERSYMQRGEASATSHLTEAVALASPAFDGGGADLGEVFVASDPGGAGVASAVAARGVSDAGAVGPGEREHAARSTDNDPAATAVVNERRRC